MFAPNLTLLIICIINTAIVVRFIQLARYFKALCVASHCIVQMFYSYFSYVLFSDKNSAFPV